MWIINKLFVLSVTVKQWQFCSGLDCNLAIWKRQKLPKTRNQATRGMTDETDIEIGSRDEAEDRRGRLRGFDATVRSVHCSWSARAKRASCADCTALRCMRCPLSPQPFTAAPFQHCWLLSSQLSSTSSVSVLAGCTFCFARIPTAVVWRYASAAMGIGKGSSGVKELLRAWRRHADAGGAALFEDAELWINAGSARYWWFLNFISASIASGNVVVSLAIVSRACSTLVFESVLDVMLHTHHTTTSTLRVWPSLALFHLYLGVHASSNSGMPTLRMQILMAYMSRPASRANTCKVWKFMQNVRCTHVHRKAVPKSTKAANRGKRCTRTKTMVAVY